MRLALLWVEAENKNLPSKHALDLLNKGGVLKFVLLPMADLEKFEIVLVIAVGQNQEHSRIAYRARAHKDMRNLYSIEIGDRFGGGGKMLIHESTLVFYSSSSGLGNYRRDFIEKVGLDAIKKFFQVNKVVLNNLEIIWGQPA